MIHAITSVVFIGVNIFIALGLTLLMMLVISNIMTARQEREGRELQQEPPRLPLSMKGPDTADFKRGV